MRPGVGWVEQVVDPTSEAFTEGRCFKDSMATKWCETHREVWPEIESVGICSA